MGNIVTRPFLMCVVILREASYVAINLHCSLPDRFKRCTLAEDFLRLQEAQLLQAPFVVQCLQEIAPCYAQARSSNYGVA